MLTETTGEDVTGSGAERPLGSVGVVPGSMNIIASFLARRALVIAEAGGKPALTGEEFLELTKPTLQNAMLLDLIEKVRPSGLDLDRWLAWMDGGSSPVKVTSVDRPTDERRAPLTILARRTKAVIRTEKQLAAARRTVEVATKHIEDLESQLAEIRATNAAILEFDILERMMSIMKSNLAVGPVWTFVRAIGSHDPEGDFDTSDATAPMLVAYAKQTETRLSETKAIFECLDLMAGDKDFEKLLRETILKLVVSHEAHLEDLKASGTRVRPMAKIKTSMNTDSRDEVARVIGSLPTI